MCKGRILGIDYGRRRIGLALSDEGQTIASPIGYITNKGDRKNLVAFVELMKKHRYCGIMCGIALYTNGNESPMAGESRKFAEFLRENLNVEVDYFDERYSSKEAEEHIKNNLGINNPQKVAEMVDTIAASMVLQEYLNSRRKSG